MTKLLSTVFNAVKSLLEFRIRIKRRPIIPARVKLKHRIQYRRTKPRRQLYLRKYLRRPKAKLRAAIRKKIRRRLGKRVKRFRLYIR